MSRESGSSSRRIAGQAVLVALAVYLAYGLLGAVPGMSELRGLALVAAFYFVPGLVLRGDEARQRRYQVGPEGPVPPWSWKAARVAAIACAVVFPAFVLFFFFFYLQVCGGDWGVLLPALWLEGHTPWAGGLERFLQQLCGGHNHSFWPDSFSLPAPWLRWYGLGAAYQIALEVFVVALPEEVFHRGYLMSAFEDLWPPRRRWFGVPFGLAAFASSAVFAIGHLVGEAEVARLATFFPALLFAWLWRRSGSLWAPALFHAASNLLMGVLIASTFPR